MPFLAYYGCSKLLKARAVFYWGTHTRFTVSVGIDLSLTKTRRTRSADCICMDKRARISALWEIVYYLDTCIVYLAVRETEYFTEILRNIPRMQEQCRFSPPPQKMAWERGAARASVDNPILNPPSTPGWGQLVPRTHGNRANGLVVITEPVQWQYPWRSWSPRAEGSDMAEISYAFREINMKSR